METSALSRLIFALLCIIAFPVLLVAQSKISVNLFGVIDSQADLLYERPIGDKMTMFFIVDYHTKDDSSVYIGADSVGGFAIPILERYNRKSLEFVLGARNYFGNKKPHSGFYIGYGLSYTIYTSLDSKYESLSYNQNQLAAELDYGYRFILNDNFFADLGVRSRLGLVDGIADVSTEVLRIGLGYNF